MNQPKAAILLIAFLTGAIQPIVPLMEYHFFKESIMELFCENRNVQDSDCDGICYLSNQIENQQEKQSENFRALADYYPGTILVQQQGIPAMYGLQVGYLPLQDLHVPDGWNAINLPPPRVS